jgi:outer membrane protein OmpA-like peptidoglycan-associated protein
MAILPFAGANAQAINGPYVGVGAGINFLQGENFDIRATGVPGVATGKAQAQVGPAVVVNLGWGFGNGLRAEVEGSYRENALSGSCGGIARCGGQEQKAGAMFNVLYDFVGMVPMIQPYVGLGAGYQWVIEQNLHFNGAGASMVVPNSHKGSFAYQAILGTAIPIAAVPGLAVTAEYRFMGLAGNRSYPGALTLAGPPAATFAGSAESTNNFNHSILFGVRYAFGMAPPPAPVMPVADVGAKTFLVFFDWNKYDLTARSAGIVRDAATYSTRSQYTRIDVDGNADTSGTPGYNQGLSERRARTVANELVRDGVPQSAISMHAYGDTKLLVPTGPNVREPQNRRVEIVFH